MLLYNTFNFIYKSVPIRGKLQKNYLNDNDDNLASNFQMQNLNKNEEKLAATTYSTYGDSNDQIKQVNL